MGISIRRPRVAQPYAPSAFPPAYRATSGRPYCGRPGGCQTGSPPSPPPPSICSSCSVSGGPRFRIRALGANTVAMTRSLEADACEKGQHVVRGLESRRAGERVTLNQRRGISGYADKAFSQRGLIGCAALVNIEDDLSPVSHRRQGRAVGLKCWRQAASWASRMVAAKVAGGMLPSAECGRVWL